MLLLLFAAAVVVVVAVGCGSRRRCRCGCGCGSGCCFCCRSCWARGGAAAAGQLLWGWGEGLGRQVRCLLGGFGWFCGRQKGKRRWGHALLRLGRHLRGGIVLACVAAVVVDVAGVATLLPVWQVQGKGR